MIWQALASQRGPTRASDRQAVYNAIVIERYQHPCFEECFFQEPLEDFRVEIFACVN